MFHLDSDQDVLDLKKFLRRLRVPEIHLIMTAMNMPKVGKKVHLIDRIEKKLMELTTKATLSSVELLQLSERIQAALNSVAPKHMTRTRRRSIANEQDKDNGLNVELCSLCGNVDKTRAVVECSICHCQQHKGCIGFSSRYVPTIWKCEVCKSASIDPFIEVKSTLAKSGPFSGRIDMKTAQREHFSFDLSVGDAALVYAGAKDRSHNPNSELYRLQLCSICLTDDSTQNHSWPSGVTITVNRNILKLVQKMPPSVIPQTKKAVHEVPIDILSESLVGNNTVEVTMIDTKPYCMLVQIVRIRSVDEMVQYVERNSTHLDYEACKRNVISSFNFSGDLGEDQDEIQATSTRLSVSCPLGLARIRKPARGKQCTHIQCFDLVTFLGFNRLSKSLSAWNCTVCNKHLSAEDLIIDAFLQKILLELLGDKEVSMIEIQPNGTWSRYEKDEKKISPSKRKRKIEEVVKEPLKKEAIDLSLSSDEEENTVSTSSHSVPSSVASMNLPVLQQQPHFVGIYNQTRMNPDRSSSTSWENSLALAASHQQLAPSATTDDVNMIGRLLQIRNAPPPCSNLDRSFDRVMHYPPPQNAANLIAPLTYGNNSNGLPPPRRIGATTENLPLPHSLDFTGTQKSQDEQEDLAACLAMFANTSAYDSNRRGEFTYPNTEDNHHPMHHPLDNHPHPSMDSLINGYEMDEIDQIGRRMNW